MAYTNLQYAEALAKHHGWSITNGDVAAFLLLPYIIMDVAYEYYRRDIKPLDLKQYTKKCRTNWIEGYTRFNRSMFDALDADMADEFCDKMDKFKRYIYTDLIALQSKMLRVLPLEADAKTRQIVSAALLCNRLARISQDIWGTCFKTRNNTPTHNVGLDGVLNWTRQFAASFTRSNADYMTSCETEDLDALFAGLRDFQTKCLRFVEYDMKTS